MQNEELQHVFNLSEHQNHRYNGYYLSSAADRTPTKTKKSSPKKKNADMAISTVKSVVKRRSKVKNSVSKAGDVINGASSVSNAFLKSKDSYSDKYRVHDLNHFNNVKTDGGSYESLNSIMPNLNKNSDLNLNHRSRVFNTKYSEVLNHLRSSETSGSLNYCKNQYNSNEYDIESNVTKATNQKFNNVSTSSRKMKLDELKAKGEVLPSYLSAVSQYRVPSANSLYNNFADRADSGFTESQKDLQKMNVSDLTTSKSCESKLFLRAKRRRQNRKKWQMDNGTRHEALQRIRDCIELQENLQNDLFPLNLSETGYEKSDSEVSEEYTNTFQNYWFHSMSEVEFDDVKRNMRLGQLYNELRRQFYQIKQNKCEPPILNEKFMKSMIEVARTRPIDAFHSLEQLEKKQITSIEPLILSKKKCALETCKNVALPCMPTCVRHVLLCDKQMLFEQCRVRDSNSFQCDRPVLNIKYHYPVCSLHSKTEFVLPDFSRDDIKYEDVRRKNVSTISAGTYKTDADFVNMGAGPVSCPPTSSKVETKKRATSSNNTSLPGKHKFNVRVQSNNEIREKEKKPVERKDSKMMIAKNEDPKLNAVMPIIPATSPKPKVTNPNVITSVKQEPAPSLTPEMNQNLLREWVNLSDSQLVDTKTLESTLQNDFVNGFDINASSIQSQIQDIINSESSLSTDMLMGTNELPNYIQVEEMIEEVEITDETLDSSELGNQELVHSEDLNAVLKQLPPEAFNELFSEFTLSEG